MHSDHHPHQMESPLDNWFELNSDGSSLGNLGRARGGRGGASLEIPMEIEFVNMLEMLDSRPPWR